MKMTMARKLQVIRDNISGFVCAELGVFIFAIITACGGDMQEQMFAAGFAERHG